MELRQLKLFTQIIECETFTAAAQKNYISQPALSKSMKNLEAELNVKLFYYSGNKTCVTHIGQELYRQAKIVLRECEKIYDLVSDSRSGQNGVIKILTTCRYERLQNLYQYISDFMTANPCVFVSLSVANGSSARKQLDNGDVDFLILAEPYFTHPDYESVLLDQRSPYYLIVPEEHPISQKTEVSFCDLQHLKLTLHQSDYSVYQVTISKCHAFGIEPEIKMQTDQLDFKLELCEKQKWSTVTASALPPDTCARYHVACIPFSLDEACLNTFLLRKRDHYLSSAGKSFMDFLKASPDSR